MLLRLLLADKHGNLLGSLTKIEIYAACMTAVCKKLMEVATHPILLLGFLILIMLGLKIIFTSIVEDGKEEAAHEKRTKTRCA